MKCVSAGLSLPLQRFRFVMKQAHTATDCQMFSLEIVSTILVVIAFLALFLF